MKHISLDIPRIISNSGYGTYNFKTFSPILNLHYRKQMHEYDIIVRLSGIHVN